MQPMRPDRLRNPLVAHSKLVTYRLQPDQFMESPITHTAMGHYHPRPDQFIESPLKHTAVGHVPSSVQVYPVRPDRNTPTQQTRRRQLSSLTRQSLSPSPDAWVGHCPYQSTVAGASASSRRESSFSSSLTPSRMRIRGWLRKLLRSKTFHLSSS